MLEQINILGRIAANNAIKKSFEETCRLLIKKRPNQITGTSINHTSITFIKNRKLAATDHTMTPTKINGPKNGPRIGDKNPKRINTPIAILVFSSKLTCLLQDY